MTVIVKNLAINYEDVGKGKTVLLLHGWQSDIQTFAPLIKALHKDYRVLAVDLPGFGGSELPKNAWDLDNYIDFVVEVLAKLKVKHVHAIVAHSMGCRIAMKGMGAGKLQADKLVLIGAHGIRESKSFRNRLFWLVAKTGRIVAKPLPPKARQALRSRLYKTAGSTDYLEAGAMKQIFTKIINEDVRPEAAMISTPTLLIYGKNDTVTPPHYGKIFQQLIEGAKFEAVAGAGHFVQEDQPAAVRQLVRHFIK